jgi:hypothetical protein
MSGAVLSGTPTTARLRERRNPRSPESYGYRRAHKRCHGSHIIGRSDKRAFKLIQRRFLLALAYAKSIMMVSFLLFQPA